MYTGLSMASWGEFMVFTPLLIFIFFYLPVSVAMQVINLCIVLFQSLTMMGSTEQVAAVNDGVKGL